MSEYDANTLSIAGGVTTAQTVRTIDDSGNYMFEFDSSAMESDDIVEVRVKDKVVEAGALLGYFLGGPYAGVQSPDDALKVSIPFPVLYQARVTLTRPAGAGTLALPWSLRRIGNAIKAAESTTAGQLAVVGTEHDLAIVTAPGDYVMLYDTSAMVSGDVAELRVYDKVLAASGLKVVYFGGPYSGAQSVDDVVKGSMPFRVEHQGKATLKRAAGPGSLLVPWSLRRVDT